jgi:Fe-S cluster assembly protein SufD
MLETTEQPMTRIRDPYRDRFEELRAKSSGEPAWLEPIRAAAISKFAELGFPTTDQEEWRYTNVAPIARLPFNPVLEPAHERLPGGIAGQFAFASLDGYRLVFVNGHFAAELSVLPAPPAGVKIKSLAVALTEDADLVEEHLAQHVRGDGDAFTALNAAFFQDGAFVRVAAGVVLDRPIQLLYLSTSTEPGAVSSPRNLIVAEKQSQFTLIESYVTVVENAYLTNAVTEFVIQDGATVEHCKFQDEGVAAFHVASLHAQLGRGCRFVSHSIATGARIARNNLKTVLDGQGVECVLNGLYLTKGDQLIDHYMLVEHAKPHCNSHEYFNGILDDRSRGVFHGRILVQPHAQKTDAKQTNKNLLLSDDATSNAKPQLEIYADDVKCTHGATVGQLNKDSIFYLRARGISMEKARRMLIHAFAGEIIDRIQCAALREELDQLVWNRLEANPLVGEAS